MVRKTRQRPRQKSRVTRRVRRRMQPDAPAGENQRCISSMSFDGDTLVIKSKKNNKPATERIYTIQQLEEEIPIGKELIDAHLDGQMPQELQHHHHRMHLKPMFNNVLLHPADLGLLPPSRRTDEGFSKRRSIRKRDQLRNREHEHMRLMIDEPDAPAEVFRRQQPRNLFDLP